MLKFYNDNKKIIIVSFLVLLGISIICSIFVSSEFLYSFIFTFIFGFLACYLITVSVDCALNDKKIKLFVLTILRFFLIIISLLIPALIIERINGNFLYLLVSAIIIICVYLINIFNMLMRAKE